MTENNRDKLALLTQVPWQLFTTFTFTRLLRNGDEERRWIWAEFLRQVHELHHDTLGYVWVEESRRAGGIYARIAPHYHALFVSNRPIDTVCLIELWRSFAGTHKRAAKVDPFDPNRKGVAYVIKRIDETEGYADISNDLHLFLPSLTLTTDRHARRRVRRHLIRQQRANYHAALDVPPPLNTDMDRAR